MLLAALLLWLVNLAYPNGIIKNLSFTLLAIAIVYLVLAIFVEEIFSRRISDAKTRYSFQKTLYILQLALISAILIWIWVRQSEILIVSYGIIGAGIAIALQDVFRSFAGGVIIFLSGIYKVGDRVEIESVTGDIIDIGILYTTILETRGWVRGDQATGRLIIVPNKAVISGNTCNYTKDHSYLWDELTFPIAYDSDWRKAINIMMDIVKRETIEFTENADRDMEKVGERYYIPRVDVEPGVFVQITDNWIECNLRYIAPIRRRRALSNRIQRRVLEAIEDSDDVRIASSNIEITKFPESGLVDESNK